MYMYMYKYHTTSTCTKNLSRHTMCVQVCTYLVKSSDIQVIFKLKEPAAALLQNAI